MLSPGTDSTAAAPDDGRLLLAILEAQVGSLVDLLPVAILVTDAEGRVLRANAPATTLVRDPKSLVGRPIACVFDEREPAIRTRRLSSCGEVVCVYVVHDGPPEPRLLARRRGRHAVARCIPGSAHTAPSSGAPRS